MENIRMLFHGTERSGTSETGLEVYNNTYNEIYMLMEDELGNAVHVCLNKPTAVRLVRELKKQIGFMNQEVDK